MSGQLLAHGTDIVNVSPDDYLGSPLYTVAGIHIPALLAVAAAVLWFVWHRRRARLEPTSASSRWRQYARLDLVERASVWFVGLAGVAHLALVTTHLDSFYGLLFVVVGLLQVRSARDYLAEGTWTPWVRRVLVASLLGYAVSSVSGEAPDQVGMLVKLAELGALVTIASPGAAWGRLRHAAGFMALSIIVAAGAWGGAFRSGEGGHHFGQTPPPGVLIPPGVDRAPTPAETARAEALHAEITAAIERFSDPAVAAAAGYRVTGLAGDDFHAENPDLKEDQNILDPSFPETLVYAVDAVGSPVLLGAMFQMDDVGQAGPSVAGPLLVWHAHDHVCVSPLPPHLSGLTGPYGTCPLGSLTLPITNEMLHVWTIPGAPDPFGDLDDAWLADRLAAGVASTQQRPGAP